ncbi:hypothetical protein NDU88_005764 [Pleurodeles waltl]|uniref:Uncharacterized protein n=1 Tax=Pleurodeles waltl TaxID=8319 RepID=A0AAV7TV98_PLEWA|nr:hypothetical protein NDU88_005764 [Pleurodeles waltl]
MLLRELHVGPGKYPVIDGGRVPRVNFTDPLCPAKLRWPSDGCNSAANIKTGLPLPDAVDAMWTMVMALGPMTEMQICGTQGSQ